MTFISLIKGFIGTAILFLPRQVNLGGWFMTTLSLTISAIFTYICAIKLLNAAKDCQGKDYMDIGFKAYGSLGRNLVGLFLVLSQTGFTVAFIYFICSQLQNVVSGIFHTEPNLWYFGLICFCMFVPLCQVRDLTKFSQFHLLANFVIVIVITSIFAFAAIEVGDKGWGKEIQAITPVTWSQIIGFTVYLYEGIGISSKYR